MTNGISFDLPISLLIPSPLDVRTVVKDITERDALDTLSLYEGLETYVKSEKKKGMSASCRRLLKPLALKNI